MAHFAELDDNNIVKQVIVVANEELLDENGQESENKGIAFCKSLFGEDTRWIQTSFNANFRNKYAGGGDIYLQDRDVFLPAQPYPSWTIHPTLNKWVAPTPEPENGLNYIWVEDDLNWQVVEQTTNEQ
jgi:hypothetical protein